MEVRMLRILDKKLLSHHLEFLECCKNTIVGFLQLSVLHYLCCHCLWMSLILLFKLFLVLGFHGS